MFQRGGNRWGWLGEKNLQSVGFPSWIKTRFSSSGYRLFGNSPHAMSGCHPDATGLGTVVSFFFRENDGCANFEATEGAVEDAVLVEIDFAPFRRYEKTVALVLEELVDLPHRTQFPMLYVASLATDVVLQTSAGSLESVIDGLAKMLVRVPRLQMLPEFSLAELSRPGFQSGLMLDQQLTSWHRQVDANMIGIALPVMVGALNRYPTAHDSSIEFSEFCCF